MVFDEAVKAQIISALMSSHLELGGC